jgi:hypothetical protein
MDKAITGMIKGNNNTSIHYLPYISTKVMPLYMVITQKPHSSNLDVHEGVVHYTKAIYHSLQVCLQECPMLDRQPEVLHLSLNLKWFYNALSM